MEEGTFPQTPSGGLPNPQSPWETPPTVFPAQENVEQESSRPSESSHLAVEPIVYRANPNPVSVQGGGDGESKSPVKKILKIGIGIFVILTMVFVLFGLILPKMLKPQVKDVALTYWGLGEDEATMRPVLNEFEQENPHIKINYIKQDPNDYRERLSVRVANGNGPDIFSYHNTWYPMISDILLPLPKETIEKSEFDSNYYDFAKTDLIKNGTIYGIPLETDTLALYINTDLFNQASTDGSGTQIKIPSTWQEFIDAATALTKRDDNGAIQVAGGGIGTFDNVNHAPDIISLLMAQNGVDLNNPTAYADKIADAIRFYTNFASVENNVWDTTQDTTLSSFTQGRLAMYFGYAPDYFAIKSQNPSIHMQIVPVPQLVSEDKVNIASYWVEGASRRTTHPKEALLFMKFLAKQSTQEKLYVEESKTREFGEPYSYVSLASKLKGTTPFVFVDQSPTAVSTPFTSGTSDNGLNTKLNSFLKQAVDGVSAQNDEKGAITTFLQGYSQTMAEYNGKGKN